MLLGQIFNSNKIWSKLTTIAMEPLVAYKILKYIKLIDAEYVIINKQRVTLLRKITNTKDGEKAQIEPDTPEFMEYAEGFNEILSVECELEKFDLTLEKVLESIREKDYTLTVQDLMILEPFFIK